METGVNVEKIGSTLEIKNWKPASDLSNGYFSNECKQFSLAVNGNAYFIIGGKTFGADGELATTDVTKVEIVPGGKIKSVTQTDSPLPAPIYLGDTLNTDKYIYLFGGDDGKEIVSTIYRCEKLEGNKLGDWELVGNLPKPLSDHKVIRVKNKVYIIGGFIENPEGLEDGESSNAVLSCSIDEDDELDFKFNADSTLPLGVSDPKLIILGDKLYVIGGYNGNNYASLESVYSAKINEDGSLQPWITEKPLPISVFGGHLIAYKNRIFLLGGHNGTKPIKEVWSAPVGNGGDLSTIGEWVKNQDLPETIMYGGVLVSSINVILFGNNVSIYSQFDGWDLI